MGQAAGGHRFQVLLHLAQAAMGDEVERVEEVTAVASASVVTITLTQARCVPVPLWRTDEQLCRSFSRLFIQLAQLVDHASPAAASYGASPDGGCYSSHATRAGGPLRRNGLKAGCSE